MSLVHEAVTFGWFFTSLLPAFHRMKHVGLKLRMAAVGAILAGFYLVVVAFAMAAFGPGIWPIAVVGSVLLIGFQYKIGKWAALRSVGAEDLSEDQYPQIHQQVRQLSRDMGIEKPTLKVARMGVPNAFAVGGPNPAVVGV